MTALSLEQAPDMSVPFRFFLTGPVFGAAAGLVLALEPDAAVASRWSSTTLATVHLMTLGLLGQVMLGALWQFMPVAAGANVPRARLTGGITHVGLGAGTLVLVAGFLGRIPAALVAGGVVLAVTLVFAGGILGVALARSPAIGPTRRGLQLAILGLVVTALLGAFLAVKLGVGDGLELAGPTAAHVGWGVAGWGLMLVASVAWLVVPMFQLTPPYPVWFSRMFAWGMTAAVTAWSVASVAGLTLLAVVAAAAGGVTALGLGSMTLLLQSRRRRRISDATLWHWRVSMALLLVTAPLVVMLAAGWLPGQTAAWEWVVGVAMLAGVFPGLITGMLFKIVPFLVWLHLKNAMTVPPTMNRVIPAAHMRWCGLALAVAVVVLVAAPLWPALARVGGLMFCGSMVWLETLLVRATLGYRRCLASGTDRFPGN
jgi:hypothetical protein